MRYIRRRITIPVEYQADTTLPQQLRSHRVKRCGTCTYQFPESDMTIEDGQERCPMCKDLYTAQWFADEQSMVARVQEDSAYRLNTPAQYAVRGLQESRPAAVTSITNSAGNILSQSSPLQIVRGGSAVTVLINGQYFTAAAVTTYDTGISDNVAPVITPTLITLSLIASVAATPGFGSITMSDGITTYAHKYPYVLAIR